MSSDPTAGVLGAGVVSYDPQNNRRTVYWTLEAYLMGVLQKELLWDRWSSDPNFLNGYKAVAVAARNILLNKRNMYKGTTIPLQR
jgi:hypothetical protein